MFSITWSVWLTLIGTVLICDAVDAAPMMRKDSLGPASTSGSEFMSQKTIIRGHGKGREHRVIIQSAGSMRPMQPDWEPPPGRVESSWLEDPATSTRDKILQAVKAVEPVQEATYRDLKEEDLPDALKDFNAQALEELEKAETALNDAFPGDAGGDCNAAKTLLTEAVDEENTTVAALNTAAGALKVEQETQLKYVAAQKTDAAVEAATVEAERGLGSTENIVPGSVDPEAADKKADAVQHAAAALVHAKHLETLAAAALASIGEENEEAKAKAEATQEAAKEAQRSALKHFQAAIAVMKLCPEGDTSATVVIDNDPPDDKSEVTSSGQATPFTSPGQ